ncbi:MAG TPA: hypothetical protein VFL85_04530 [Candidatus Saccharimonadales bacterium]|nr:hypothetical protein [Candidatus Saccharimonadales bacterium]
MMRYVIGFIGVIAILVLIIVLIVRGLGGGGGGSKQIDLADYETATSQVIYTIEGPVSATQTHDEVRISVDQSEATIDIIKGYEDDVTHSKTYPMNPSSYTSFLLSLKHAGYTNGNSDPAVKDERGYCPTEDRYVYELKDNGEEVQRFWNTSCDYGLGTFNGKSSLIEDLFRAQVPDYDTLTQGLNL